MRYEGETGSAPWNDEGPVRAPVRQTRSWAPWEETPNVTEIPVPGDPVPCSTEDPELWVGPPGSKDASYAAVLCAGCWMKADCVAYGVEHPDEVGVWGGLSMRERRHRYSVKYNKPSKNRGTGITRSRRWGA